LTGDAPPSTDPFFKDTENVQMMDLSPKGTYLLTWERWYEDKRPDNMRVWETSTGRLAASFPLKGLKRDAWPNLQWTADEAFAALHATSEVRFYAAAAFVEGYVRVVG
jgi:translation initiation factor 2A